MTRLTTVSSLSQAISKKRSCRTSLTNRSRFRPFRRIHKEAGTDPQKFSTKTATPWWAQALAKFANACGAERVDRSSRLGYSESVGEQAAGKRLRQVREIVKEIKSYKFENQRCNPHEAGNVLTNRVALPDASTLMRNTHRIPVSHSHVTLVILSART